MREMEKPGQPPNKYRGYKVPSNAWVCVCGVFYYSIQCLTRGVMQNEELADAYDIQRYAVEFEGSMWYHTNNKWTGDRYVLVYFSTDFSKHDRERGLHDPDTQTEEERARPPLTRPVCTPIDTDSEECAALRAELMEEIQKVNFLNKRQQKYGAAARICKAHFNAKT